VQFSACSFLILSDCDQSRSSGFEIKTKILAIKTNMLEFKTEILLRFPRFFDKSSSQPVFRPNKPVPRPKKFNAQTDDFVRWYSSQQSDAAKIIPLGYNKALHGNEADILQILKNAFRSGIQ